MWIPSVVTSCIFLLQRMIAFNSSTSIHSPVHYDLWSRYPLNSFTFVKTRANFPLLNSVAFQLSYALTVDDTSDMYSFGCCHVFFWDFFPLPYFSLNFFGWFFSYNLLLKLRSFSLLSLVVSNSAFLSTVFGLRNNQVHTVTLSICTLPEISCISITVETNECRTVPLDFAALLPVPHIHLSP